MLKIDRYWHPTKGETLDGKYIEKQVIDTKRGKQELYVIDTGGEIVGVNGWACLSKPMKKVVIGEVLMFEYDGLTQLPDGKQRHQCKVSRRDWRPLDTFDVAA
jgi:hypothetical protein